MAIRPHKRIRQQPGISANELARYLVAGDHAREGIIRRAKEIATAPVIRYRDLRNGLAAYLGDAARPSATLATLELLLQQKADDQSSTGFTREDAQASLEALATFRRFQNQLGGFDFKQPGKWAGALPIEGVAVSVYPDLALTQQSRSSSRYGIALFRLAKGDDQESVNAAGKRTEIAKYVATLAYMQASAHCAPDHVAYPALCMSIDVQNQQIVAASNSQTIRVNNIKAACRQIARAWDAL
ncbi:hypothetical protein [Sphingomonas radiodurans]|uniref:hypothetical protein n=1 Tax=Sphingomonas radiodurans TaxID=2890321 RepID=UPI001E5F0049|nr:hypothetical protein [Sphingomonas radiodurans]WBH15148.1 hypothetical protein LLW23_09765 [Sphingomonas radiodurans]